MEPNFSDGVDKEKLRREVETLYKTGWELDEEKIGLVKTYPFKTYTKCLVREAHRMLFRAFVENPQDFLLKIGIKSKTRNHHSTMTIVSASTRIPLRLNILTFMQKPRSVQVHWTTHNPHGLSDKDIGMAKYCDDEAQEIGTENTSL